MDLQWSSYKLNDWINGLDLSFGKKNALKLAMQTNTILDLYYSYVASNVDGGQTNVIDALRGLAHDFVKKTTDGGELSVAYAILLKTSYSWTKRQPHRVTNLNDVFPTLRSEMGTIIIPDEPTMSLKGLLSVITTDPDLDAVAEILQTIIDCPDEAQRTECLYILATSLGQKYRRDRLEKGKHLPSVSIHSLKN